LLEYKPGTVNVGPGLATGYTMSNGGKTYSFTLRKGVRFQDGTPFNATALVQDLDRLLNPHNKYYVLKEPGAESFISFTYRLVEWVKNDHITVAANPYYWGPKPHIQRIIFQIVPEGSVRLLKLQRGEAQIDADVTTRDYQAALHTRGIKVLSQVGQTVNGIGMTVDVKPLTDQRVRQALNYAVDRRALATFLFKGLGTPMNSYLPPS